MFRLSRDDDGVGASGTLSQKKYDHVTKTLIERELADISELQLGWIVSVSGDKSWNAPAIESILEQNTNSVRFRTVTKSTYTLRSIDHEHPTT